MNLLLSILLMTNFILGDSLTPEISQYLTSKSSFKIGAGLAYWKPRLHKILNDKTYDNLIIILGINDWDYKDYKERVTKFILEIKKYHKGKIYWVSAPPAKSITINKGVIRINEQNQKSCIQNSVYFIDLSNIIGINGNYLEKINNLKIRTPDGIHLSNKGGEIIANTILETLKNTEFLP